MTRSELIAALASRFPQLVARDAEMLAKELLAAITASIVMVKKELSLRLTRDASRSETPGL